MSKERIIGLFFSISLLLVILFLVLTPQIDYQQEFVVKEAIQNEIEKPLENDTNEIKVIEKTNKPISKKINSDITKIDVGYTSRRAVRTESKCGGQVRWG